MQVLAMRLLAELISASGMEAYAEPLERLVVSAIGHLIPCPPCGEPEADEGVRNTSSLRPAGLSRTYLRLYGKTAMPLIIHVSSRGANKDDLEIVH